MPAEKTDSGRDNIPCIWYSYIIVLFKPERNYCFGLFYSVACSVSYEQIVHLKQVLLF